METKTLKELIVEYQAGESDGLVNWIINEKEISIFDWYNIKDLFIEEFAFNMPCGSYYLQGTVKYLKMAMEKVSEDEGNLTFNSKLAFKLLADNPDDVEDFLKYYNEKTHRPTSYCLSDTLLKILPGKPWTFWESFYNNFIDGIIDENFSDKEIFNIVQNINTIFDLDISQHKAIAKAIEWTQYPKGQAMTQALIYSSHFDKFILPRNDLSSMGRTEERQEFIKKVLVMINKVDLENNLNESNEKKKVVPKNKI